MFGKYNYVIFVCKRITYMFEYIYTKIGILTLHLYPSLNLRPETMLYYKTINIQKVQLTMEVGQQTDRTTIQSSKFTIWRATS